MSKHYLWRLFRIDTQMSQLQDEIDSLNSAYVEQKAEQVCSVYNKNNDNVSIML